MKINTLGSQIIIEYKGITYSFDKTVKNSKLSNLIKLISHE